jgi:PhnB protein
MASVKPIPDGYHSVTPYLCVKGASEAIEFYKKAFGATELGRLSQPDGRVGHAELQIGSSRVMLSDEHPEMGFTGPGTLGGSPVMMHLYVEDADAVFKRAVEAGATEVRSMRDEFYGDRAGGVKDPFGHTWHIATHKEDLTQEEVGRRAAKAMGGGGGSQG